MERRLFLAFFLTLAFLFIWGRFVSPPPPAEKITVNKPTEVNDSLGGNETILAESSFDSEVANEDLPWVKFGELFVTYSATGGYIEKIAISNSENLLPFRKIGLTPEDSEKIFKAHTTANSIIFKSSSGSTKEFVFDGYNLAINLSPADWTSLVLFVNYPQESMMDQRYQEVFYSQGQGIKRTNSKKFKEGTYRNIVFAGGRDRYYCFSLLKGAYDLKWLSIKNHGHLSLMAPASQTFIYVGPQTSNLLRQNDLQEIIYYGFFHAIGMVMIKLLYLFYSLTKNWGLSIILFAGFVYGCLFPFTMKSTKAMRKMQEIQPELAALKIRHKDNPQKFSREQMALFKKYHVNPLGGCLPLFLQFPIFIALYQVLFRFVELKGASFLWIKDLSLPDQAFTLPFKIPILGSHINILPILIMIVGLVQQRITTAKGSSPEQKSMGLFFSVFLGVIFYNFPSALVLYWFIQNLLTFAYQLRISKTSSIPAAVAR